MKMEELLRCFEGLQEKLGRKLIGRGSRARPYISKIKVDSMELLQFDLKVDNVKSICMK